MHIYSHTTQILYVSNDDFYMGQKVDLLKEKSKRKIRDSDKHNFTIKKKL